MSDPHTGITPDFDNFSFNNDSEEGYIDDPAENIPLVGDNNLTSDDVKFEFKEYVRCSFEFLKENNVKADFSRSILTLWHVTYGTLWHNRQVFRNYLISLENFLRHVTYGTLRTARYGT